MITPKKVSRCRDRNRAYLAVQAPFDYDNDNESDNEKTLAGKTISVLYSNNPDAKRRGQLLAMTVFPTFYRAMKNKPGNRNDDGKETAL
jgi:hypothetical protein